jgi:hypothetical protein
MMPKKPGTGGFVVARRPLHGLDKSHQRGQRRSELVAGIGHKVGPHPVHAAGFREIAERDDKQSLGWIGGGGDRCDPNLMPALRGHPLRMLHALGNAASNNPRDKIENGRRSYPGRQHRALGIGSDKGSRSSVLAHDLSVPVEDDRGHVEGLDNGKIGRVLFRSLLLCARPGTSLARAPEHQTGGEGTVADQGLPRLQAGRHRDKRGDTGQSKREHVWPEPRDKASAGLFAFRQILYVVDH